MTIPELYKIYSTFFLVDTDTRKIRKNTIFFALKGNNFNGNSFAEQALGLGAIYSIVDEEKYVVNSQIILVENVLETLQELAKYHRKQLSIPIIGLTGSNGKTTTKELINVVLSKKHVVTATLGNLNNHIGVPLTLLSMTPKTELGIVEMGANHAKEIAFLANISSPDFGYITNFGKAHLEGFGSVEGVIEAKSELYNFLIENNKFIFVNPKDTIQVEKTNKSNRIFFEDSITFTGVSPCVCLTYKDVQIKSNLIGAYNYTNIAAAITIGVYFNVAPAAIKAAIEAYIPSNNRSQILKTQKNDIILDAYNANPTSMKVAIENFNLIRATSKTVILGDMFELGNESTTEHQQIVDLVLENHFNTVYTVGEAFFKAQGNHSKFKTFEDLEHHIKKNSITNNYILIKGSRAMALERILPLV